MTAPRSGGGRRELAAVLMVDVLGGAVALLASARVWQTVTTPRSRPLRPDVLDLTGRTVAGAPTALALVALAGVVAILATRGVVRRVMGAVLAVAGGLIVSTSAGAGDAVSSGRARALVFARHSGVGVDPGVIPHVQVHPLWLALSLAAGGLVALAGLATVVRGHRWSAMSGRYDAPGSSSVTGTRAPEPTTTAPPSTATSTALWSALDRGDDPTAGE